MFPQKGVRVIGYPFLRNSVSVALTLLGLRGVVQCLLGLDPTLGPTDRGRLVTTPLPLHNRRGGGHGREPEGAVAPVPNRAAGTSGSHCTSINVYTAVYLGGASEKFSEARGGHWVHPGAGEEAVVCPPPSPPPR